MADTTPRFEEFVRAHVDDLLRTAYLISWDEKEAEDLVQETLFKVAQRWRRVATMEYPLAYARRILVRQATGASSRRLRFRAELDLGEGLDLESLEAVQVPEELSALEIRAELTVALGELNTRQRTVIVLRYFLDLSEAETAQALDCPVGTVKSAAARGLAELRRSLAAQPQAQEACLSNTGAQNHD